MDMDGLELMRAFRSAELDVRVLVISGSLSGEFLRMDELLGAVGTLSKPFTMAELVATVDRILKKANLQG
jgi:DNA-binding response OmpR family regulator